MINKNDNRYDSRYDFNNDGQLDYYEQDRMEYDQRTYRLRMQEEEEEGENYYQYSSRNTSDDSSKSKSFTGTAIVLLIIFWIASYASVGIPFLAIIFYPLTWTFVVIVIVCVLNDIIGKPKKEVKNQPTKKPEQVKTKKEQLEQIYKHSQQQIKPQNKVSNAKNKNDIYIAIATILIAIYLVVLYLLAGLNISFNILFLH